jgi:hypothetical protein
MVESIVYGLSVSEGEAVGDGGGVCATENVVRRAIKEMPADNIKFFLVLVCIFPPLII